MILKSEWRAKAGGKRQHLFPADFPADKDGNCAAACGHKVPRRDIRPAETANFCSGCLLAAGFPIRLTPTTPVGVPA